MDPAGERAHTASMRVTPVPRRGEVLAGRDARGRAIRVGSHPEQNRVVVSIWQDDTCLATVRLAGEDLPTMVRALTQAVIDIDAADRLDQGRDAG